MVSAKVNLKFLSVFSGAGGLDLGLEAAGFDCVGTIEHDDLARETLRLNRSDWCKFSAKDVCEVAATISLKGLGLRKGELSLLAGAPPCQPFSPAGQWAQNGRLGLSDPRASTLDAYMLLVERLLPETFVIENVPGFASESNGGMALIKKRVREINEDKGGGYVLKSRVIDCSNFGVPQKRKRLIIVGGNGNFNWADLGKKVSRTSWDALHSLKATDIIPASGKWSDLLPSIPEGKNYLWHTSVGGGAEIFGNRTRFWNFLLKLAKSEPAWTISAQPGPSTGPFHWDNRPLSPTEAKRLQTFPLNWKLPGSYREKIKLIGNATPPLLGERLGRALVKSLGGQCSGGSYKYGIQKANVQPSPTVLEKVHPRYSKQIGPKKSHPGSGMGPSPRSVVKIIS